MGHDIRTGIKEYQPARQSIEIDDSSSYLAAAIITNRTGSDDSLSRVPNTAVQQLQGQCKE